MSRKLRNLQLYRNSDVNAFTSYTDTVNALVSKVTNDAEGLFCDGQMVLGRYTDGTKLRTIVGVVIVSGDDKYVDFLCVSDDVTSAIDTAIDRLDSTVSVAGLNNGTLTIKQVVQENGVIGVGNTSATLYVDTTMSSTNPLVSETTVNDKIAEERAKDYINSSEYESGSPLNLTSDEIDELRGIYQVGHIVHDEATNRFYAWYGNAWGYPTVNIVSSNTLAEFNTQAELLMLNDEPIRLEGGTLMSVAYIPVYGEPSDWSTNWDKYYVWDSTIDNYNLNTSDVYDNTRVYHIKNITSL